MRHGIVLDDYWLSGLARADDGHLSVVTLWERESVGMVPVDRAMTELDQALARIDQDRTRKVVLPMWCLHSPRPIIESVRSLLMPVIPEPIARQVAALRLENPTEVRAHIPGSKRRFVSRTIIDPTSRGVVILGNAADIGAHLETVGSRFVFPDAPPSELAKRLRDLLGEGHRDVLGSSLLIGALVAILSFEMGFLMNRILTNHLLLFEHLFAFLSAVGCLLLFLFEESFEHRMIAFLYPWTFAFKIAAWFLVLAFVMVSPAALLGGIGDLLLLRSVWAWGLLLGLLGIVYDSGRVFYVGGISKGLFIALRCATVVALVVFAVVATVGRAA